MKYIVVILFFVCSTFSSFAQQTLELSLIHANKQREYILYVPANYSSEKAVPLLFNFHGYTSNATEQMFYGDFRPIADTAGFLIVHPMGTVDAAGNTHFNVGWGGSSTDDVGFAETLIATIADEYNIDLDRVYSTGMSNGGFMSYHLACQLSGKIAAIASVTGSMSPLTFNNCNPEHPTPVLEIHGTADQTVPYNGAVFAKPIEEVVQYWVNSNNCNNAPTVRDVPNTNTSDGTTVEHFVYTSCDNQVNTEFFKITNGSHTWAGTFFGSPGTNYDINASIEVWNFVSRYEINGLRVVTDIEDVDAHNLKVHTYPNPIQSTIHIEIEVETGENLEYQLMDIAGKVLLKGNISSKRLQLEVGDFSDGLYLLKVGNQITKIVVDK